MNSSNKSAVVISHRKDADGISSAALIRYMTGANVYLTDYGDMVETLSGVEAADQVHICDLGTNKNTFDGFFEELQRLRKTGEVHYTDHHPIHPNHAARLRSIGVDLYHSLSECAAMLTYGKYEQNFINSPQMKILACTGAITDYMDLAPFAKKLIAKFDRQFLLYEATMLSFTIAEIGRGSQHSNSLLVDLAEKLSESKLPHEIPSASDRAQEYAAKSAELIQLVRKQGKKRTNFAYFMTKESSTGNVANFLIGAFDIPVGVALREEEPGYYEISLRSTDESIHDLGKVIGAISAKLNASGGGHTHASGARIKSSQLDQFLNSLDEELSYKP